MMSLPVTVPPGLLMRSTMATMSSSSAAACSSASTRATVLSSRRKPRALPRSSLVITPEMSINRIFLSPEPLTTRSSSGCGRPNGLISPLMNTHPLAANASSDTRQRGTIERLGIGGRRLYSWVSGRGKMRSSWWARRAAAIAAMLIVACACGGAASGDEPAVRIDKNNVESYKAVLPQPVYDRVRAGDYVLPLVPVDAQRFRANYTDRFWKASAANQGKYGIDPETGGLTESATGKIPQRFFGLPFPEVKASDPQAGAKIVHNYRARRMQMDGDFHTFELNDVTQTGEVLRTVKILLSQRYYIGTTAPPPDAVPDNTESRQLGAALAPKDLEGVGVLTWRFNDWTTWDQVWAYLPTIRRVRRVRSSIRGDRVPGFEVQGDDADCYDNKTSYFTWKLVGESEVIGPLGTDDPYARELRDESPTRRFMELPYNKP